MYTEDQLLKLLKIQSNLTAQDFTELFGESGDYLFQIFARENWNLLSFLFNKINGENRIKLLDHINKPVITRLDALNIGDTYKYTPNDTGIYKVIAKDDDNWIITIRIQSGRITGGLPWTKVYQVNE